MAARVALSAWVLFLYCCMGCGTSSDELTPKQFAEFYADIVIAQESALDSATAIDSALAIAGRNGISNDQLERFRERIHADPVLWIDIWEMVIEEVQSRRSEDTN